MQDVKTPRKDPATSKAPVARVDHRVEQVAGVSAAMSAPRARANTPKLALGPRLTLDHVLFDESPEGTTWAAGHAYKASFDRSGATYFPFFGACAPRNYPITFKTAAVTLGGRPLAVAASAAPVRAGDTVAFDRGALVERYELALAAMEQSFVFSSLPWTGDLVLQVRVETELGWAEDGDDLRLGNELGHVRYTRAHAVDAAGTRLALSTHFVADGIQIVVPEEFLALVEMPLTIDPLVGVFAVDTSGHDDVEPDIAYDLSNNVYGVCWESTFSAADHDVYVQLQDASGTTIAGSTTSVDLSSINWAHPRIANNNIADQFLIVAAVGDPSGGARQIWGRERSAASFMEGPIFRISDPLITSDQFDPDVGGDPLTSPPTFYCATWERAIDSADHDIFARLVQSDAVLHGTSTIYVDNSSETPDEHPTVSKSDGNGSALSQYWTIVWQREYAAGDHDIWGAQIHWDGTMTNPSYVIDFTGDDDTRPTVSSILDDTSAGGAVPRNYLVAFERQFSSDKDIMVALMNGDLVVNSADLITAEGPAGLPAQNQILPSADSDGRQFVVAYSELVAFSTSFYGVQASTLTGSSASLIVTEAHESLNIPVFPETGLQITSQRSSGAAPGTRRCATVWTETTTPSDRNLVGAILDSASLMKSYCFPGSGGVTGCPCGNPPASPGIGCNNSIHTGGALLTASGVASLAGDTLAFSQSGELASALSIVLQGNADNPFGSVFGDGVRCVGGALKRLYTHTASGGVVNAPTGADPHVHVRSAALGDTIAPSTTRLYQAYYRDPNLAFCPAGYNAGNAILVTWTP